MLLGGKGFYWGLVPERKHGSPIPIPIMFATVDSHHKWNSAQSKVEPAGDHIPCRKNLKMQLNKTPKPVT
jgi:hypothetical protein